MFQNIGVNVLLLFGTPTSTGKVKAESEIVEPDPSARKRYAWTTRLSDQMRAALVAGDVATALHGDGQTREDLS